VSASIIPFRQPHPNARPHDARLERARETLRIAESVLPLVDLAWEAMRRSDLATARACLDEIVADAPLPDAPRDVAAWRLRHILLLARAILAAELNANAYGDLAG